MDDQFMPAAAEPGFLVMIWMSDARRLVGLPDETRHRIVDAFLARAVGGSVRTLDDPLENYIVEGLVGAHRNYVRRATSRHSWRMAYSTHPPHETEVFEEVSRDFNRRLDEIRRKRAEDDPDADGAAVPVVAADTPLAVVPAYAE